MRPNSGHRQKGGPRRASELSIAYLVSEYPAYSHEFVSSEIDACRERGLDVVAVSLRRGSARGHRHLDETIHLRSSHPLLYFATAFVRLLTEPRQFLSMVAAAAKFAKLSNRPLSSWRQMAFLADAVNLHSRLEPTGVRHLHVHFANNASDVARLVVEYGNIQQPERRWSWSLTIHGPTDLAQADGFGLAGKVSSASFTRCISDYCRRQVVAICGDEIAHKLRVVHMGVRIADRDQSDDGRRLAITGSVKQPFRVLYVGRLVQHKGLHDLMDACARLSEGSGGRGSVLLTVIGDGPANVDFHDSALALGDRLVVDFMGAQLADEVREAYRVCDVFALPSYSEGVPVVLMEAMAARVPVVATAVAGVPELVTDGVSGFLVAPGDVDGLSGVLDRLRTDPVLRRAVGHRGRSVVKTSFNVQTNAVRLTELFVECA